MRDVSKILFQKLYELLQPIGLPVFSVVPDNESTPYIFIGEIVTQQTQNKDKFQSTGAVMVELSTGTINWTGSLDDALGWLDKITRILQPYRNYTIDLGEFGNMVTWTVDSNSGLFQYVPNERIYTGQIYYNFEVEQSYTYTDRVEADGGTVEALNCVIINT